jgi:hypothetical protein
LAVCRDFRSHRAALFDGIEEGAIRSSAYSSQIHEHENDQAMDSLHDRVSVLKRVRMMYFFSLQSLLAELSYVQHNPGKVFKTSITQTPVLLQRAKLFRLIRSLSIQQCLEHLLS